MQISIGNAPCSWGVEFADDPRNPHWAKVLDETKEAGYAGVELGPVGFMPEDPEILGPALTTRRLALIGGVEAEKLADRIGNVQPALVDDRGGVLGLDAFDLPDEFRLALLDHGSIEADDSALRVARVLLAVADVDPAAVHDRPDSSSGSAVPSRSSLSKPSTRAETRTGPRLHDTST